MQLLLLTWVRLVVLAYLLVADRIRSMEEGYVFTGVCHSVHNGGGGLTGCVTRGGGV